MKKSFSILFFLLCCMLSHAQLSGTLLNTKGKPVKRIHVKLKNTTVFTTTDEKGTFLFQNITPGDTIVVEVSKREDAVIPVKVIAPLTITLQKSNFTVKAGDEILTKEYQRKKHILIDNIITREQIEEISASNIYDILRYNVQGVKVTDTTDGSFIIIRNSPLEPLFVVDGIYFESSAEVDVHVSATDIERIEILRDGEGYGYRGGNGVIIITTRK